ncbi:peptidyl-alpha-hydroxyglycine alpha-amidating lyase 1 [Neocloeon triangulifer]|uniref:peptidyl-alpha-hydroxyglycine alpha-amidating lyase 1 n=1 Tax=Neocloeon triangulifer TaxID=2078957 RepID=UPI00286ED24B|nr:peptidyl-alpha-hydroxyglycine alpha-amidating lyase 1 [Neocloeon triangulifer]
MAMKTYAKYLVAIVFFLGSGHTKNTFPRKWPENSYGRVETRQRNEEAGSRFDYEQDASSDFRHEQRRYQPDLHTYDPAVDPEAVVPLKSNYVEVSGWPLKKATLGQISAVSFDNAGNVVIFHRANHVWDASTFDNQDNYRKKDEGPIEQNTIITYNPESGRIVHQWGANLFYLPHGLTVDQEGHVFLTDVALHQVFKFPPRGGQGKPLMVLGERFIQGNDRNHFCKPTSVAVTKSGDFFVADGYCNHRVIKFNEKGEFLLNFGRRTLPSDGIPHRPAPTELSIPHSLALAEEKNLVCVADRENGRIQCFRIDNGTFVGQIAPREFGRRLFSVAYTPLQGGMLFAVNGPDLYNDNFPVHGFAVGITSRQVVATFGNFNQPHDIAVSFDGKEVYVVELDPHKISKFVEKSTGNSTVQRVENPAKVEDSPAVVEVTESAHQFLPIIEESPHVLPQSVEVLIVVAALVSISMVAVIFVLVRKRGPCCYWFCNKKWHFRRTPSETFKLGHLLDPHSGFELVGQEMSDEEIDNESDSLTNSFTTKA